MEFKQCMLKWPFILCMIGVREAEVESLAGIKEGCEDDIEFMTVKRPAGPNHVITSFIKDLEG